MFASLERIQHPLVRSVTAAFTTCSVITLVSAVAIGVTNAKAESTYKAALYSAVIGAGCGAAFGLAYSNKAAPEKSKQALRDVQKIPSSENGIWKDWRHFVVVRKVPESEEITSFYLQPADKGGIPSFQPGQFLTIKLEIPGQANPVIRTYSLSDYPEPCDYYRLSIKREPMPNGLDVPPGLASNFMHDHIHEGSVIAAKPPSGKFILDVNQSFPAVLISNGVGITPMISMAKAAVRSNPQRPIWFIHGARDGRFHAFQEEVTALANSSNGSTALPAKFMLHVVYSRPREEDTGHYHSTGYVDVDLIQSLVNQEADYFLCGSPPFMDSIRAGLKQAGVPDSRVFFEMFTKPRQSIPERRSRAESDPVKIYRLSGATEIVFARSNKTASWQTDADSLLEFAEANDLNPPYSCRQGICGTCQCKLLEGEVDYREAPTATIEPGSVLICISQPRSSRVVLDL